MWWSWILYYGWWCLTLVFFSETMFFCWLLINLNKNKEKKYDKYAPYNDNQVFFAEKLDFFFLLKDYIFWHFRFVPNMKQKNWFSRSIVQSYSRVASSSSFYHFHNFISQPAKQATGMKPTHTTGKLPRRREKRNSRFLNKIK